MRADLFDAAVFHDHDLVGGEDRRKPMRDGDHGPAFGQTLERDLDLLFALGVERGGGFVEQEDRRVLEQCARDREPLLLAAGEEAAFVADDRLVALRLGHDEVVRVGGLGGGVDFFRGGIEPAELDVFEDGVVKQKRLLRDEADLFAQGILRDASGDRGHRCGWCRGSGRRAAG